MDNQRAFMNEIAVKLNIKNPSDWGKITVRHVYELGGVTLLSRYYKGSLYGCLKSIYQG